MSAGKKRAPKGAAVCPAAISGMITMLRYQAEKCKDPAKKEAGAAALEVYQGLSDASERAQFLKEFEENGKGKTPGSLKFTLTFKQRLKETYSTSVGAVENFITRPQGGWAELPRQVRYSASCVGGACAFGAATRCPRGRRSCSLMACRWATSRTSRSEPAPKGGAYQAKFELQPPLQEAQGSIT